MRAGRTQWTGSRRTHWGWLAALTACSCASPAAAPADRPAIDGGLANPSGFVPLYDASAQSIAADSGPCQSTFQAIQRLIFQDAGCSGGACHTAPGPDTPAAGLDLTVMNAYRDLVNVPARTNLAQPLVRVAPGLPLSSFLYLKLAASGPAAVPLPAGGGAPMPLGLPPLAATKLALLRAWIEAGAPETGLLDGTQSLVDACQSAQ